MALVLPDPAADANPRGFFGQGDMQKEFEEASFALKPGEISPVIETASGLHLIERYVVLFCATFSFCGFCIPVLATRRRFRQCLAQHACSRVDVLD